MKKLQVEGWKVEKLIDVCDEIFAGGDVPKDRFSKTKTDKYSVPIFSNGEKNNGLYGYTDVARVTAPSITISARGTIGFSAIRIEKYYPAIRLIVVIPKKEILDLSFLQYAIQTIEFDHSGVSIPQLTVPMVSEYVIPIPPLPEQQRIVSLLDETFAGLAQVHANAERNLVNAREVFNLVAREIFENRGDDWNVNKIQEVCELKSGTTISTSLEREKGDVLYVKVGDMNLPENLVEIHTSSRFVNSNEINQNQIIPEGAIIFPKRGGAIATNKKRKIIKPTIVDLNTMAIIPSEKIDKDFLYHWFQLFDLKTISNGANVPQINHYSFDDVYIYYPKSLEEQRAIVERLDALAAETSRLEAVYQSKLEAVEELKKSVLGKAFEGEL